MKVKVETTTILKPTYEPTSPPSTHVVPLTVFDKVTYDTHIAVIYAYRPPTPPNATIKLGLQKTLAEYREFAGRLGRDEKSGNPKLILLNDEGVKLVEASTDARLDEMMPLTPSPAAWSLHPALKDVEELVQVQLTRFGCGSLVVGFISHHLVADGRSTSKFLVTWGRATRGLDVGPLPFRDRAIFSPREPPVVEHHHRGAEYETRCSDENLKLGVSSFQNDSLVDDIVFHKVHFTLDFLSKLKSRCCTGSTSRCSTFVSVAAHLWRTVTKARNLGGSESTRFRISVDGRTRMMVDDVPRVPDEYFGNLVLWAFPTSRVEDLLNEPLSYAAQLINDAVARVNDGYFKSFVDFASHVDVEEEGLVPTADAEKSVLSPDLEVHSWLRYPFYDVDFGGGCRPCVFMPSFFPAEGVMFMLSSFVGDGSVDAFVPLLRDNLDAFEEVCYVLDQ
ncbi:unnamed protein product [Linum trigynum]|uniref:Uncharacterized protein n=1 Tax=Linum trigynum TaxID=586398 RepID=A0AAV2EPJ2_9ROSI